MEHIIEPLVQHGYWILFVWVLLDQFALPVPALPVILAAGALAGAGHLDPVLCTLLVVAACLPANLFWYWLGIRQGNKVLSLLCIISLEPDTCVNSTTSAFHRYGSASILFSKFIPGLNIITPPLAGLLGVGFWRFILMNGLGSLLYALAFILPGYLAHEFIIDITRVVIDYGLRATIVVASLVLIWIARKVIQRQLFLRTLRGRRIDPMSLFDSLNSEEPMQVADLRQRMEFNAFPQTIPGAMRVPLDIFDEEIAKLAPDKPLVLFCTCPNELSSARVALKLKQAGFTHVAPLEGGLEQWIALELPLEERPIETLTIS
jgi:membrane protein DedA with SNARE-associated domain/rhodanese-related sulfurtransferase